MNSLPSDAKLLRFGTFELDPKSGELRKAGIKQQLAGQPFKFLQALLEHPGEVVTREELRDCLWPDHTAVDYDLALRKAVNRVREVLGDAAESPRFVETIPRRGYRFLAPVTNGDRQASNTEEGVESDEGVWKIATLIMTTVLLAASTGGLLWRSRHSRRLTEKDTIVLADFNNTTGDAVFDDILKQGLAVQLDQSPFLSVLSDQKVHDTLKLMGRSSTERLTPELARDLCQRVGSKAYLGGVIAGLGSQYAITLNLINCQTGDSLVHEQVTAAGKEQVLKALGDAAKELRGIAGESLASIQQFDVPIEQATTTSLDALKAYSLGTRIRAEKGAFEAIPFFKQAVERDPNFASAYALLGLCYTWTGERDLAREYIGKAYQLRDRTSEREKLRIAVAFFWDNELHDRRLETAKLWAQEYPRDAPAHRALGGMFDDLGQYENAIAEYSEANRLDPTSSTYGRLIYDDAFLNRLSEAKASYQQGLARGLGDPYLREARSYVAWLENDQAEMDRQMASAAGKRGLEGSLLNLAAGEEAVHGHLNAARSLRQRAIESALKDNDKLAATLRKADQAQVEADYGNSERAREGALAVLAERHNHNNAGAQFWAAFALARAGDSDRAKSIAGDLEKRLPDEAHYWLPTIHAAIELNRNNPAGAIELLRGASRFQTNFYEAYLRGLAYLLQRQGSQAASEFQKVLDNRALVGPCPHLALSHLGLARAYALQGDTAKARAAYQDFLTLWRDADPDISMLRQAKAEYANLQ